jgi:hypothetical protein
MQEYVTIVVDQDLLVQITKEILALAEDPNHVEVTHGTNGQVLLVHPRLADRWYSTTFDEDAQPLPRKRGRPRKYPSASPSEESS